MGLLLIDSFRLENEYNLLVLACFKPKVYSTQFPWNPLTIWSSFQVMIMKRDEPQAALYLVGTKCDIATDAVDQSDADSYALSENCKHIR